MWFLVELLSRLLVVKFERDDRVSVFAYFLAWQLVAIVVILAAFGWSAFSAPW